MMNDTIEFMQKMGYISENPVFGGLGKHPRFEIINRQAVMQILRDMGFTYHHTAHRNGYVRKSGNGNIEIYSGRFGNGFIIENRSTQGTLYHEILYYIMVVPMHDRK